MKVLFVSAEALPFSKTGGLGDVAASLPKALRQENIDARVMISKSFDLADNIRKKTERLSEFEVPVGWRKKYTGLLKTSYDSVPYYLIDNEYYFKRDGLYGYYDDGERFAYFSRAVLESIKHLDFKPDVIHFNDWHTAIIPFLLKEQYQNQSEYKDIKTVFTIHNLKYQGVFGKEVLGELLNAGERYKYNQALDFYGDVNFIKSGIYYADKVTTVSETYSKEIQYPFFGENLDGVLRDKNYKLQGITNGLDYSLYHPGKDSKIHKKFDRRSLRSKKVNKMYLQEKLGLNLGERIPLVAMVSRLVDMKGLDLIERVFEELVETGAQFVFLGTGDPYYENMLRYYARKYPKSISANIKFDTELAHQIYAGSDLYLMPSKFEPCGLSQLIAMRYGSLPIVRETGGLKDTVTPYNQYTEEGNGFSFSTYNAHDMLFTVQRAVNLYNRDQIKWQKIIRQAMKKDSSWTQSARLYKEIYEGLVKHYD
jgi:starch synthase